MMWSWIDLVETSLSLHRTVAAMSKFQRKKFSIMELPNWKTKLWRILKKKKQEIPVSVPLAPRAEGCNHLKIQNQPVDHASWPECHTYLLLNREFTVEETYHIKGSKQEWFNTKMCVSYLLSHRGCTAEESPTSIDWINKTTRRCVLNTHTKCVKNVWDGYHALPSSDKDRWYIMQSSSRGMSIRCMLIAITMTKERE